MIAVISVIGVDPHLTQEGLAIVTAQLGLPRGFMVHDGVFDDCFQWRIAANYVRVGPCVLRWHADRVGE